MPNTYAHPTVLLLSLPCHTRPTIPSASPATYSLFPSPFHPTSFIKPCPPQPPLNSQSSSKTTASYHTNNTRRAFRLSTASTRPPTPTPTSARPHRSTPNSTPFLPTLSNLSQSLSIPSSQTHLHSLRPFQQPPSPPPPFPLNNLPPSNRCRSPASLPLPAALALFVHDQM